MREEKKKSLSFSLSRSLRLIYFVIIQHTKQRKIKKIINKIIIFVAIICCKARGGVWA